MENITQSDGFVYLIQAIGTPKVKIGYSTDPKSRLKTLKTGSPVHLRLIQTWAASAEDEKAIHRLMGRTNSHLEWFAMPVVTVKSIIDNYFSSRSVIPVLSASDMLPALPKGYWWDLRPAVQCYRLKLRWREDGKQRSLALPSLTIAHLETLQQCSNEERERLVFDLLDGAIDLARLQ